MSEQRFGAEVDGLGRLRHDSPEAYAALLQSLKGKRVVVTIKRERNTRTAEQNAHLWGHVYSEAVAEGVELVELETGTPVFRTLEDVHGFAKLNLLRRPVMTNRGEINLLGTTTTLTPAEFSEYVERLVAKLAGYGVYIPPTR